MSLLSVRNLKTHFATNEGTVKAVDGVSFDVDSGEIVGVVGESGSGKSVMLRSVLDLINPPGQIVDGTVRFDGQDLLSISDEQWGSIRGGRISMIFQDPEDAFNPTQTVGRQLHDILRTHRHGSVHPITRILGRDHDSKIRQEVIDVLDRVGIPSPEARYSDYPHEFSGGMLQRAMIAMSVLCKPDLILADEPTTALDVTIESQILSMFRQIVDDLNISVVWVTHDLSVVSELCDYVVVLYAGKVMEIGPTEDVIDSPVHPYTKGLLESVPRYDLPDETISGIKGSVPSPHKMPEGCNFADRCPKVHNRCHTHQPPMYDAGEQQGSCFLLEKNGGDVA